MVSKHPCPGAGFFRGSMCGFLLLLLLALTLGGCALPSLEGRSRTYALDVVDSRHTRLGEAIAPGVEQHPGKSGVYPLANPLSAFSARMALARAADRTLDVQYYIWHDDMTGTLLLEALHAAAERGVRVRLLLDDTGTAGLDPELAALDSHPNIEVRLFNPFVARGAKWLGYLTDFSRLNRRMHNKSFTADNQATIIGGRNIGDAYFGATDGVLFTDLDLLSVGPVVNQVSADFDRYWHSPSSYPVYFLFPGQKGDGLKLLAEKSASIEQSPDAKAYMDALRKTSFNRKLMAGQLALEWATVHMVSDDPAKVLDEEAKESLVIHQMRAIIGSPETSLDLISPYFVPTENGVNVFSALARDGVDIRILTNSLAATDVAAVHAGYAKRREALLRAGVRLYETRPMSARQERNPGAGRFGSSATSLHAKTFAVDGEQIFVGSFNFDPRSFHLNTELGFIVDSPKLASRIDDIFDGPIAERAYEVRVGDNGYLYWLEQRDGTTVRYNGEPQASSLRRGMVFLLSLLPIEWML